MSTQSQAPAARQSSPLKGLSGASAVWLVAERETITKVRSKSFIISTIILLVLIIGGIMWFAITGGPSSITKVAATSDTAATLSQVESFEVTDVADRGAAEALVENGDVDAAAVDDPQSPTGTTIIALEEAPQSLIAMFSVAPTVEILDEGAGSDGPIRYLMSFGFGLLFLTAAMTFGTAIVTSVIEEKATRVVEIIIATVPARVLLAGKVLGNTIIAMGQILLIMVAVTIGLAATGQGELLAGLGGPLVWFAVFFLVGFIVLAAAFAAGGSLVSRQEDSGPVMTPLIWIVMAPYMLVIFFNSNDLVMNVMSYVPIASVVAMPVRLFFNEAQWWEPVVSLLISTVAALGIVLLGAKIYERSLLKMGARVKLLEALRG